MKLDIERIPAWGVWRTWNIIGGTFHRYVDSTKGKKPSWSTFGCTGIPVMGSKLYWSWLGNMEFDWTRMIFVHLLYIIQLIFLLYSYFWATNQEQKENVEATLNSMLKYLSWNSLFQLLSLSNYTHSYSYYSKWPYICRYSDLLLRKNMINTFSLWTQRCSAKKVAMIWILLLQLSLLILTSAVVFHLPTAENFIYMKISTREL